MVSKTMIAALAAGACCVALAAPVSAWAGKGAHQTRVTLEYTFNPFVDEVQWSGEVRSNSAKCEGDRRPKLYQRLPGKDDKIGKSTPYISPHHTNLWGYVSTPEPDVGDKFYATIGKKTEDGVKCKGDQSKTVTYTGP